MSSKPKEKDYAPSEMEKTQAAIAQEEQRYFEQTYQPLLTQQRDLAAKEKLAPTLKGRAQADTMQALTGQSSLALSRGLGQSANIALGSVNQQLGANTQALNAASENQLNVLGTATGQRMTAGDALAQSARLSTSQGLAKAAAKQQVRMAKSKALFDIGMAAVERGLGNIAGGGSFGQASASGIGQKGTANAGVAGTYSNLGFFGLGKRQDTNFNPWKIGGGGG